MNHAFTARTAGIDPAGTRGARSAAAGAPRRAAARVAAVLGVVFALGLPRAQAQGDLNVLIWSDYFIGPKAVAEFGKAEGMNIKYGILDSDDTLQAKLLSGHSGYDVVYPSSAYISKQIEAGVYQELDWSKIPNRVNLDPELMKKIASQDPGNKFGVPYVWGTDGIAINVARAREVLGKDAPLDGWNLLFDPAVVSKLHKCGVSMLDQASDVFPHVLAYMGRNPNSRKPQDYQDAYEVLRKIRPYIDQFSSTYINDMAGGDMCISMAWSGDVGVIRRRAQQAGQKFDIRYVSPKGQSGLWFTFMGIPKDAANKDNAYKWINHMLDVKVAADITNAITYPTAIPESRRLIRPELIADPAVFPTAEDAKGFFMMAEIDPTIMHLITKLWLQFKAGN